MSILLLVADLGRYPSRPLPVPSPGRGRGLRPRGRELLDGSLEQPPIPLLQLAALELVPESGQEPPQGLAGAIDLAARLAGLRVGQLRERLTQDAGGAHQVAAEAPPLRQPGGAILRVLPPVRLGLLLVRLG